MTSPKEVFFALILNKEWVNAVLDSDLFTVKQLHDIFIGPPWVICNGDTDSTAPFPSPNRHGIIHHIPSIDIINIRSPEVTLERSRTRRIVESGSGEIPVNKIYGLIDRDIGDNRRLCRIKIENSWR